MAPKRKQRFCSTLQGNIERNQTNNVPARIVERCEREGQKNAMSHLGGGVVTGSGSLISMLSLSISATVS